MPGKQQRREGPKHDASYKNFFAHSRTVADTLRAAAGELARHLDFATLERMPNSFVGGLIGPVPEELLGYQPRQGYLLIEIRFSVPAKRYLKGSCRCRTDPQSALAPARHRFECQPRSRRRGIGCQIEPLRE